ncbi:MAG: DUF3187 family protein [Nitrospirota bacterium]|nr:MAG: DUF3187 family protein [Nitrospirota bacterium]
MRTRTIFAFLILMIMLFPGALLAFQGPLYIRNSHPLFIGAGNPLLTSAVLEESADLNLTYSSTYLDAGNAQWSFLIDIEAAVADIRFSKIIDNRLEIGVDVPFISYHSGVLDGPLATFHDMFGFDDYGRSDRPQNEFALSVTRNGETVLDGSSGKYGFGDIVISAKEILKLNDPVISVYAFADLPTGDAKAGLGNGSVDWGISLLMDKSIGGNYMSYLNIGYGFSDEFKADRTIPMENYIFGAIGVELKRSEQLSLYSQLFMQQSPFSNIDVGEIDGTISILSFGFKYISNRRRMVEFSFSEDPGTTGAPDFMIAFSLKNAL